MEVSYTTTQKVGNNPVKGQQYQELFRKMKDWGRKSVYELHNRFSTLDIFDLLECGDIYPVNFVEGWKEYSKDWTQEEYDRMKGEFFKGFKDGLLDLRLKEVEIRKSKEDKLYDYELQPWDRSEWGRSWCKRSYKPWIYGK